MPAMSSSWVPPRMCKPLVSIGLPVVLALVLALPRLGRSQGLHLGAEFQVNTYTTGTSYGPSVAAAVNGDFVVVWTSSGQDGSYYADVFGRRYTSAGVPMGDEFQVNTYTTDDQYRPAVAVAADGDFVVVWNSDGQDGDFSGVFGQRYANAGAPVGAEFQVNTLFTASSQSRPAVAAAANGDFVVVWNSYHQDGSRSGVFGRRYSSAGVPVGEEFQVNTSTPYNQDEAAVAAAADGDFVVVWSSIYLVEVGNGVRVSDTGVFGQRYTSAGVGVGGEFQVNTYTTFHQRSPAVAAAADGDFVVVWTSNGQEGNYSELPGQTYDGVFGQRYTSAGVRMGDEFQVNTYTTGHQFRPAVAAAADGNFVVVWNSAGQYGGYGGMFGQRYTSAGDPLGGEFQVDRDTGYFSRPALAAAADGDFVVVREDYDGQDLGVFGQRFAFFGIETTTSSTTTVSTSSTTSSSTSTTSSTTSSSSSTTDSSLTSSTTTSSTTGPSSSTTSTSTPATTTLPGATTTMPGASTTTVTLTASTTTTVASLSTFLGRLSDALPDVETAPDKPSRNAAKKLGKLDNKASTKIGKCTDASGNKQQKLCKKARAALNKLLNAAQKANDKGTLGVLLDPIEQAVTGALELLPA